ncbi:hypothetical protein JOC85_001004 [Bacillus mesophilus]|uniref:Tubby C-terminal domain-containing protein n=1 Tax=Bacillus mesophilus TaxID=1808955 RepID=A0A6M0Q3J0_9BACI|nr:hypothetical protein [Bacillus mesophilus]MBM7660237.1 hypothetical protein [Bacillus mesophilus]NEY70955.1 hypothetical protein [Bacillus mesophilus]
MSRLLVLFIAGFIGMSLRYILNGEFEANQLFTLLLFPVGSIFLLFVMKYQYNKDRDFKPEPQDQYMVTMMGDRVSRTKKHMYLNTDHIGSYQRCYSRWWKRVVADVMDNPGQWYLNLNFSLSNGDTVTFKGRNENNLKGNSEWIIYRNDRQIGTVSTDYSLKNATKLQEGLFLEYGDQTYYYKSFGIGSRTEISLDDSVIATGERVRGSVYQLVPDNPDHIELEMIFMGYILFNYQFGQ